LVLEKIATLPEYFLRVRDRLLGGRGARLRRRCRLRGRGRGGWGGAAAGAAAGLAVGATVGALSAAARPLVVGGQTYYYDNNTYYQPCYQGSASSYCVVQNPNQ
jgi:hypothetical protein